MATYLSTDRYALSSDRQFANRKVAEAVKYAVYTSREGDTFDLLAIKFMSDYSRYWEIADINPHIQWPDRIPVGSKIRIPI
jgi:hypothetical protein